jgi:hypothetical protein
MNPGRAADKGFAEFGFELGECAGIYQSRDDLARVIGLCDIGADDSG